MRIMFNHGISAGELYTNTPKEACSKGWRFLNDNYGWSKEYRDAIAGPFRYCFGLILHRMIDEQVRFKIPYAADGYLDFEIVHKEQFIEQRQNGRFQNIDFIQSDFTGYALKYYFRNKAYKKSYPIYLGGELKNKLTERINQGIKFYTTKDLELKDFVKDVHKVYKDFEKKELYKLLILGFRRLHSCIRYGCAATITAQKYINCYAYIGDLSLDIDKQIREYIYRRDKKHRKIDSWLRTPFDGYYYIGLTEKAIKKWAILNKNSRTIIKFERVMPRKLMEEWTYRSPYLHIFRIELSNFKGWSFWAEELIARKIAYMGDVTNMIYTPREKTWLQLRKEYEESNN